MPFDPVNERINQLMDGLAYAESLVGENGWPVRLSTNPHHPWFRADFRDWRVVLHGRLVEGAKTVDCVEGWCEGVRMFQHPDVHGGQPYTDGRLIVATGPFQIVPAELITDKPARVFLHNMGNVVDVIGRRAEFRPAATESEPGGEADAND